MLDLDLEVAAVYLDILNRLLQLAQANVAPRTDLRGRGGVRGLYRFARTREAVGPPPPRLAGAGATGGGRENGHVRCQR